MSKDHNIKRSYNNGASGPSILHKFSLNLGTTGTEFFKKYNEAEEQKTVYVNITSVGGERYKYGLFWSTLRKKMPGILEVIDKY